MTSQHEGSAMLPLKPCPFCGGATRLKVRESDKLPLEFHVACFGECEVSPSVWRGSETEAIEAWNRRAAPIERENAELRAERDTVQLAQEANHNLAVANGNRAREEYERAEDLSRQLAEAAANGSHLLHQLEQKHQELAEARAEVARAREILISCRNLFFGKCMRRGKNFIAIKWDGPEGLYSISAQIDAALSGSGDAPTHRHKKRGTEYVLIGIGKMQSDGWIQQCEDGGLYPVDMAEVAIYRGIDDGSWWARPREEFEDGLFEVLGATPTRAAP